MEESVQDIENLYTLIDEIANNPSTRKKNYEDLDHVTSDLNINSDSYKAAVEHRQGETPLHSAVKKFKTMSRYEKKTVRLLAERFPKMITSGRDGTMYGGQTPFHMSVCKGNTRLVQMLIDHVGDMNEMMRMRATGENFRNTVMMAEVPISIAALTFNKEMVDLLISHGAAIDETNSVGDNICHSLIRYGYLYPEKVDHVTDMFQYLIDGTKQSSNTELFKKIWVMNNTEGMTPLTLAAKLGQHDIFSFILDIETYCFRNSDDGLFDIKIYDVTEIDAISSMSTTDAGARDLTDGKRRLHKGTNKSDLKHSKSVLMLMFELEPSSAFQFMMLLPVRRIIDEKWQRYKVAFYAIWLFYIVFTGILTWYTVERAQQDINTSSGFDTSAPPKFKYKLLYSPFVTTFSIILFVFSVAIILLEVFRVTLGRMPYTLKSFSNPYSNSMFRVSLLLIACLFIIDICAALLSNLYENYCLLMAMIIACFCHLFFIRALRPFSFFTVLIMKVIIGDMFRFFIVIGIEVVAFTTAMYMTIQGSDVINETNFSHFGRVLFSMLTLMVGLGDTADLYKTRHPELAITIFISFVIFTTLLMINSLIAMISRSCSELVDDVGNVNALDRHWHLQRLSLILFIESVLPDRFIKKVGDRKLVPWYGCEMPRYLLQVRSMKSEEDVYPNDELGDSNWKRTQTLLKGPWNLFRSLAMTKRQTAEVIKEKPAGYHRSSLAAPGVTNAAVEQSHDAVCSETQSKATVICEYNQTMMSPVEDVQNAVDNDDGDIAPHQNGRLDIYRLDKEKHTLENVHIFNHLQPIVKDKLVHREQHKSKSATEEFGV